MAIIPETSPPQDIDYPYSDGRPVAETPIHRDNLLWSVYELQQWFTNDPMVYVSGNMFLYYEEGNRYKSVAPDVFVVLGASRDKPRRSYRTWEEDGHGPDMVIEMTSLSSKEEDTEDKLEKYRDILRVREYFLFDPEAEYLNPPLLGYRLVKREYRPISAVEGRLPSEVTGLHLERSGSLLRFYDPTQRIWLPTPPEIGLAAKELAAKAKQLERQTKRLQSSAKRLEVEAKQSREEAKQSRSRAEQLEAENKRLRDELDERRRRP